jgi:hypothetical protein
MSQETRPQLLSSVNGEITAVLLVYPGLACAQGDAEYADIVAAFDPKGVVYRFRQAAPGFKLKVSRSRALDEDSDHPDAAEDPRRTREIQDLRPGTNMFTVLESWQDEIKSVQENEILTFRRWAQDPFLVLKSSPWTILLDSLHNRRLCDFFLPLEVARQAGPEFLIRPTTLYLEGGNILRGHRCVLIGYDLIQQNIQRVKLSESEIMDEFRETFGVDEIFLIRLGRSMTCLLVDGGEGAETWQPLFHIDMLMNLGGRLEENDRETVFLASPQLCEDLLQPHPNALRSEAESHANGLFEEIGVSLGKAGFAVVRLPIFFYDGATFSWNNCLVEVDGQLRRVYLPSYQCAHDPEKLNPSFQILEAEVEAIYVAQGFEVVWFRNGRFFRTLARHGGSLNCAVKVMARKPLSAT